MNKFFMVIFLFADSMSYAVDPEKLASWHDENTLHAHLITTKELKQWMDAGKTLTILDARTKEYDDGNRLPGAYLLPSNSTDRQITDTVPGKNAVIIVYCNNANCPASQRLVSRLLQLGYSNVYKYSAGIEEWVRKGYPLDQPSWNKAYYPQKK